MFTASFALLTLLNIFSTISDMGFVVKILVFSYILYWLFVVFREQQMILGLVAVIAGYFMLFHAISITVLVLLFFVFIVMSGHFQFIIDMGVLPILGMFGLHEGQAEDAQMNLIQKKLMDGQQLTNDEIEKFKAHQHKQANYEQRANQLLSEGARPH